MNRQTLIQHELRFVKNTNSCTKVRIASTRKMTQLVEGLRAVLLDKVTATAADECLKTTELFTELNPDSSERV